MNFPAQTIRLALQFCREEVLENPAGSLMAALWLSCRKVEQTDEARSALYNAVAARLKEIGMLESIDRALAELPA